MKFLPTRLPQVSLLGTLLLTLFAIPAEAATLPVNDGRSVIIGVMLGMMLLIGGSHLYRGWRDQQSDSFYYAGAIGCCLAIALTFSLKLLPSTGLYEWLAPTLSNLALLCLYRFAALTLPLPNEDIYLGRGLRVMQLLLAATALIVLPVPVFAAQLLTTISVSLALMLLVGITGYLIYQQQARLWPLLIGWTILLIGYWLAALNDLSPLVTVPILPLALTAELLCAGLWLARDASQLRRDLQLEQQRLKQQIEDNERLHFEAEESHHELESKIEERTFELEVTLRELQETNRQLELQSTIDGLTGVKNRSFFDKRYAAELRVSRRQQTPLAVMMVDIDHFKLVNDTHGHLIGDQTLRQVAQLVDTLLKRPTDNICRYGGEEFALLLPNTNEEGAASLAETIRTGIAAMKIELPHNEVLRLTVSIGVASTVITPGHQENELLSAADQALYQAKTGGRNQVITANNTELSNESAESTK